MSVRNTMTGLNTLRTSAFIITGVVGGLLWCSTASAQDCPPVELYKVIASDGGVGDEFGNAVAIDGQYMLIGADHHDGTAGNTGAVYVFDVATGLELYKFTGSDENLENRLGAVVAIEGTTAMGGAAFNTNENGEYAGAVFVFDVTTGIETMKLTADDGHTDQNFGSAVAIDGNTLLIGALGDNHAGDYAGAAYLIDMTTGEELFKLTAHDPFSRHYFGSAGDIEGDYAVVGAWADNDQGSMAGAVYVYDTSTGVELHKLTPPSTGNSQRFGSGDTIAIEGDLVLVGAPGKGKGVVYAYNLPTGQYIGELKPDQISGIFPNFGNAVDISGNLVLISATGDDVNGFMSGSAFIFDLTTGQELAKFNPADGAAEDYFGWDVALDGANAVIGSNFADNANGEDAGSAYLFDVAPNTCPWLTVSPLIAGQNGTFTAENMTPSENAYLVYSVAGLGSTFVPQLNITLDIKQPKQAGNTQMTDGSGFVEWALPVPGNAAGVDVWLQVAQYEVKTNVVATTVQ